MELTSLPFVRELESKNPRAYMLAELLSHPEVVRKILRGFTDSQLAKHKGLFHKLLELRAEGCPNKTALVFENGGQFPDERLTYAQLYANAMRMAMALREEGFSKGDKLALVMRNHPEYVYALAACSLLGLVLVPIDPRAKGEKLAFQLADCDAKAVVTTADLLSEVEAAKKSAPNIQKIYLNMKPDADPALAQKYPTVNEMLEEPLVEQMEAEEESPSLPIQIIYTSGVTGNPKGVTLDSRRNAMSCPLG